MDTRKKTVVIVDAYSSGNLLAPALKERGYCCVHVQSTKEILPIYASSFEERDFIKNIKFQGSLRELMGHLSSFEPLCVIAGIESGVLLADALSEALELQTNGTQLSSARRNKFKMHEVLEENGVAFIPQFKSKNLHEIFKWVSTVKFSPVVLKPLHSAGTDCVFICSTPYEIENAFENIIGKTNKLGLKNSEVLVQKYLKGTEYVVNTVSCDGRHMVSDIWQYKKQVLDGVPIYDAEELLPFQGEIQEKLCSYIFRVLDALNIKYGPAHHEVMMTEEGPILIEMGARLAGGGLPSVCKVLIGQNQVELTLDAYLNTERFMFYLENGLQIKKHGINVVLISPQDGKLRSLPLVEQVKKLPSYYAIERMVALDTQLYKTKDLFTAPGVIILMHRDREILWRDYEKIREFESDGFYDFYPPSRGHDGYKLVTKPAELNL